MPRSNRPPDSSSTSAAAFAHSKGLRLKPAAPDKIAESLARAFEFAARDVRYVSIQIGIGGYKPHTPSQVCSNRYGDCKDKAFLLSLLLRELGAEAYPALVNTKLRRRLDVFLPSPFPVLER